MSLPRLTIVSFTSLLIASSFGCSSEDKSEAEQINEQVASRLQGCGLATSGKISFFGGGGTELDQCYLRCLNEVQDCADLETIACDESLAPLAACGLECENEHSYTCDDGTDIPDYWVCDGEDDCEGGDDEEGCVGETTFTCDDGESYPINYKCDGFDDCDGSEDEVGCSGVDVFECGDGTGVPRSYVCDFEEDCDNGRDEAGCGQLLCD